MKPKIFIDGEHGTTACRSVRGLPAAGDIEVHLRSGRAPQGSRRTRRYPQRRRCRDPVPAGRRGEGKRVADHQRHDAGYRRLHGVSRGGWLDLWLRRDGHGPGAGDRATSKRVANPGCWPQGPIATLRPLVKAGLLPAELPVSMNGISGYSGGGRTMIEDYEAQGRRRAGIPALRR